VKIEKTKSWEVCHLPKGENALPTKWGFDPKLRARLVVCGNFEKKSDVETFVAIVNMIMVKLFFLFVAVKDWECLQFNFKAAFLMDKCQPDWYTSDSRQNLVMEQNEYVNC
jgi:hypothetical protein